MVNINDRKYEISTTSIAVEANTIPPLGLLTTFLDADEVLVWRESGMEIEKENQDDTA